MTGFSQHQAGIQYANYADVVTSVNNPALITSSKVSIGVNIINAEATVFNNYTRWTAPFSFISFFTGGVPSQYVNPEGLVIWQDGYATTNQSKSVIQGNASVRALGPSILINSRKLKAGLQVGVNIVGFGAFTNTSEAVGRHVVEIRPTGLFNTQMIDNQSDISIGFYKEFYLSLSKELLQQRGQRLHIGLTGKYLTSNNFLGLGANSIDYTVAPSVAFPNKSRTIFDKTQGTFFFAEGNLGINATSILQELVRVNSLGTGFAGTIGLLYESRPNQIRFSEKKNGEWVEKPDQIGYDFKIGISVEDIGYLKYQNVQVGNVDDNSQVVFDNDDFRDNARPNLLINLIERKYNLDPATYLNSFQFMLPTRIHAFVDYKFRENKFVTAFVNQAVFPNHRIAPFGMSSFGIVPRYETKNVMLSVPVVVSNNFQNFTFGITGRFRSVYVGTNHLPGFFNFSKTRGISLYGGAFVPIYGRQEKLANACYYPVTRKAKKITPFKNKRSY